MVVRTINGTFCIGDRWLDSTLETRIVGKKSAGGTGNLMHPPGSLDGIAKSTPQGPGQARQEQPGQ